MDDIYDRGEGGGISRRVCLSRKVPARATCVRLCIPRTHPIAATTRDSARVPAASDALSAADYTYKDSKEQRRAYFIAAIALRSTLSGAGIGRPNPRAPQRHPGPARLLPSESASDGDRRRRTLLLHRKSLPRLQPSSPRDTARSVSPTRAQRFSEQKQSIFRSRSTVSCAFPSRRDEFSRGSCQCLLPFFRPPVRGFLEPLATSMPSLAPTTKHTRACPSHHVAHPRPSSPRSRHHPTCLYGSRRRVQWPKSATRRSSRRTFARLSPSTLAFSALPRRAPVCPPRLLPRASAKSTAGWPR